MNKKKAFNLIPIAIGLILIIFAPMIGNNMELHSVYEDATRSYFTYIAYTISYSILGLTVVLLGAIAYHMGNKK